MGKKDSVNTYDLSGEFGIGYTLKGEEFYFDLEDYDKIKDFYWVISVDGYVVHQQRYYKNKVVQKSALMHRLILNITDKKFVADHIISENKNDNRKSNLRVATYSENNFNMRTSKSNTSGCKGVSMDKRSGKWEVYIGINYKRKFLGYFSEFEDAVKARKDAEMVYFGEFSIYNRGKSINV
jgi:hypothetical protein